MPLPAPPSPRSHASCPHLEPGAFCMFLPPTHPGDTASPRLLARPDLHLTRLEILGSLPRPALHLGAPVWRGPPRALLGTVAHGWGVEEVELRSGIGLTLVTRFPRRGRRQRRRGEAGGRAGAWLPASVKVCGQEGASDPRGLRGSRPRRPEHLTPLRPTKTRSLHLRALRGSVPSRPRPGNRLLSGADPRNLFSCPHPGLGSFLTLKIQLHFLPLPSPQPQSPLLSVVTLRTSCFPFPHPGSPPPRVAWEWRRSPFSSLLPSSLPPMLSHHPVGTSQTRAPRFPVPEAPSRFVPWELASKHLRPERDAGPEFFSHSGLCSFPGEA